MEEFNLGKLFSLSDDQTKEMFEALKKEEKSEEKATSKTSTTKDGMDLSFEIEADGLPSQDDVVKEFERRNGPIEDYLSDVLLDKGQQYAGELFDHVTDMVQNKVSTSGEKEDPAHIVLGIVTLAKDFTQRVMSDDSPMSHINNGLKSALIAQKIEQSLDTQDPKEEVNTIIALMAVASLRLSKLAIHAQMNQVANEMVEAKKKQGE